MIEDIKMATNSELLEEINELKSNFEKTKVDILEMYNKLKEFSERYDILKNEYTKRGGTLNE